MENYENIENITNIEDIDSFEAVEATEENTESGGIKFAAKKINLKELLGKKQMILASLVFILAIAIYLNWQFAAPDLMTLENQGDSSEKNYGDTMLVDSGDRSNQDFFTEAHMNRQRSRDEASETLTNILRDSSLSEEEQSEATERAVAITTVIQSESKIENLIRAKGFEETIAYLDGVNCNVVVRSEGLTEAQVAQIKDIILRNSGVEVENITITEVK